MVGPLSLCCCWEFSQHLRCCAVQSVGLGGPVAASFRGHGGLGQVKGPLPVTKHIQSYLSAALPPTEGSMGACDTWGCSQTIRLMKDLFLQTHAPLFLDPQPRVQVSVIFGVQEEEGDSQPRKCFGLARFSVGCLDSEPGRMGLPPPWAGTGLNFIIILSRV